MNKGQLLVVWAENFHQPPPPTLRKQLMVPILAYRIQEKEYGGLSHSARSKLRQIANRSSITHSAMPCGNSNQHLCSMSYAPS